MWSLPKPFLLWILGILCLLPILIWGVLRISDNAQRPTIECIGETEVGWEFEITNSSDSKYAYYSYGPEAPLFNVVLVRDATGNVAINDISWCGTGAYYHVMEPHTSQRFTITKGFISSDRKLAAVGISFSRGGPPKRSSHWQTLRYSVCRLLRLPNAFYRPEVTWSPMISEHGS